MAAHIPSTLLGYIDVAHKVFEKPSRQSIKFRVTMTVEIWDDLRSKSRIKRAWHAFKELITKDGSVTVFTS